MHTVVQLLFTWMRQQHMPHSLQIGHRLLCVFVYIFCVTERMHICWTFTSFLLIHLEEARCTFWVPEDPRGVRSSKINVWVTFSTRSGCLSPGEINKMRGDQRAFCCQTSSPLFPTGSGCCHWSDMLQGIMGGGQGKGGCLWVWPPPYGSGTICVAHGSQHLYPQPVNQHIPRKHLMTDAALLWINLSYCFHLEMQLPLNTAAHWQFPDSHWASCHLEFDPLD